jgi:hypothetical protein
MPVSTQWGDPKWDREHALMFATFRVCNLFRKLSARILCSMGKRPPSCMSIGLNSSVTMICEDSAGRSVGRYARQADESGIGIPVGDHEIYYLRLLDLTCD